MAISPLAYAQARRTAERKHLVAQSAAVQLSGRPAASASSSVRRTAGDSSISRPSSLPVSGIDVRQLGVENLDFQPEARPGPLEQLRERC